MRKIHHQIIAQLKKSNPTITQLSTTLNYNHNGIRGRISELRRILTTHTITMRNHTYHLEPTISFFLTTLSEKRLFYTPITITYLSSIFNTTPQSIITFLSSNFTEFHITQINKSTVKIAP